MPVSTAFDDPYYSRSDGLAEARHVFLEGNNLAERFRGATSFHVAELGFGTGLNFLACWALWRDIAPRTSVLKFTSFERFPMKLEERKQALSAWPEIAGLAHSLENDQLKSVELDIILGDARDMVPKWTGLADAWFLDGFAPQRNPEMWEPALLDAVSDRTVPGGTLATYSAAGAVRRALGSAGFAVAKRPGFGSKRDMSVAQKPDT